MAGAKAGSRSRSRAAHDWRPNISELAGSRVFVLGLGRAGIAACRFLLGIGARLRGWDDDERVRHSAAVRRLERIGLEVLNRPASARADLVIASPGIASSHPALEFFRRRGSVVADELDLASLFLQGPLICVTGTNGKSTTAALIARMLSASGKTVFCGGNLAPGRPLSAALRIPGRDWYVAEVSSFQLERARWLAPHVALILNVTPDHLDRHGTMRSYAECKFRLLDHQRPGDFAVLAMDDPVVRAAHGRGLARKLYFSVRRRVSGAYLANGRIWFDGEPIMGTKELRLRGRHNMLNALAALCAVRAVGVGVGPARRVLRVFAGLPHRLEPVRELRGVEYVDNSMCTNPAAGARSLEAFDNRVVLIAGGREKGLPRSEFVEAIVRRAGWVILIGENRELLADELRARRFRRFDISDSLRSAVRAACHRASRGDVVLFSPGFASFDMFRDFADRGRRFKDEVRRLR